MRSRPPSHRLVSTVATAAAAAVTAAGALVAAAPPALAAGPDDGPYVVSLGDSYISGEAGRWAGSSNSSETAADALGAAAYHDAGGAEAIARCHRSSSAEIHFGAGTTGVNLACSGATVDTYTSSDGWFKPGLDFYDDGAGHVGQAAALRSVASEHDVDLVVVSIGGNDFDFAGIVQQCVINFLGSPSWYPDYCHDDSSVETIFTPANVAAVQTKIASGLVNVREAMRQAGYADDAWTMIVQTYPSPIPRSDGFRYGESGYDRQFVGGCGFWDDDADWANDTALPTINGAVLGAVSESGLTNTRVLDLASAFDGRRLCESSVGLLEERGLGSWTEPGAVDQTEWVNQIRTVSTLPPGSPYMIQESLHPNHWAQLATRSCLRQAYNGGAPVGGACAITGAGLVDGEPVMQLR